jgi:hypothetical protein
MNVVLMLKIEALKLELEHMQQSSGKPASSSGTRSEPY